MPMQHAESNLTLVENAIADLPNTMLLQLTGDADFHTVAILKPQLMRLVELGNRFLILDMTAVTYMDSTGYGVLLSVVRSLRPSDGGIHLFGCNGNLLRMLEITRLETVIHPHATEEAAIEAVREAMQPPPQS